MLFQRNQVLCAKIETTSGELKAPAATDAIRCGEVNPEVDGVRLERFDLNTLSALQEKLTNKRIRLSIPVHLKGSGAAGTAPEWGVLAQVCGLKETSVGGPPATSVTYTPTNDSDEMKTCTIYLYKDGLLFKLIGCMGNVRVVAESGNYFNATFDVEGKYVEVIDTAIVTPTYDDLDPVQVQEGGLELGSWADAVAPSFSFSTGNTISQRRDVNSAEGLLGFLITARDPRYEATIEAVLETANSFWADFEADETMALAFVHGDTAGNIIEFAAPAASCTAPKLANQDSLTMYNLAGQLLESSGEDNFTITVK